MIEPYFENDYSQNNETAYFAIPAEDRTRLRTEVLASELYEWVPDNVLLTDEYEYQIREDIVQQWRLEQACANNPIGWDSVDTMNLDDHPF